MAPFNTTWAQYQGDSASSGYAALRTACTLKEKWWRQLPFINGSSPVVDPADGAICICDTFGHLWRISPFGEPLWARTIAENAWGSTPAIDNSGQIYAIFSWGTQYDGSDWSSVLVAYNRSAEELWRYQPPRFRDETLPSILIGSPKLWQQPNGDVLIFFTLKYFDYNADTQWFLLVVMDQRGIPLATAELGEEFIIAVEGARVRPHHAIWRPPTVGGLLPVAPPVDTPIDYPTSLPEDTHFQGPSPAIFENGPADQPIVIATNGVRRLGAWRWQGRAGLVPLWQQDINQDADFPSLTSPAVYLDGLLALAGKDSEVKLFDTMTGNALPPWPAVGSSVYATPTSFLRQIYVGGTGGDVAMIDSNGTMVRKGSVGAECAFAGMVTGSFFYVSAANGFYCYDLFLNKIGTYAMQKSGQSSPAVGADGTVYFVGDDTLHAFSPPD